MKQSLAFAKCQTYIDCQLQPSGVSGPVIRALPQGPAVTISRQAGSNAAVIAERLAAYLEKHDDPGPCPWTVFDRNLVNKVLEEHNLPKRLAQHMPEKRLSYVQDVIEELLGLHPSSWTLVHKTMETVLHLAQMGRVILVGHGAHVITAEMPNAFHVRLVGSMAKRVKRVQQTFRLSEKGAIALIKKEDVGRVKYLKTHFQCDIDNPLSYHLVLNTDKFAPDDAAQLIGQAALNLFRACPRVSV